MIQMWDEHHWTIEMTGYFVKWLVISWNNWLFCEMTRQFEKIDSYKKNDSYEKIFDLKEYENVTARKLGTKWF